MENQKIKKLQYFILIFIALYPIFDMKIFYNNITTLVRCVVLSFSLVYLLFQSTKARKHMKYIIAYFVIVIVYFIMHHANALNFNSVVPGNFNYSILNEMMQIWKMTMPAIFLFIIYHLHIEVKKYYYCIQSWIVIICGSVIILNLLNLSYGSYSDQPISGNILTWFQNTESSYYNLASKGYFMHPNQISAIILMITPWNIYFLFKYRKTADYILLIMICISSLMIGTKVIGLGIILSLVMYYLCYLFYVIIKKELRFSRSFGFCIPFLCIILVLILPYSPMNRRVESFEEIQKGESKKHLSSDSHIKDNGSIGSAENGSIEQKPLTEKQKKIQYIENNYIEKRINNVFICSSYPYQYDPDFWIEIMNMPLEKRLDYRFLEQSMVERVILLNGNTLDKYFGISSTRVQNIFNIERDFVLQFFSYGIIGLFIFFAPYLFIIFIGIKRFVLERDFYTLIGGCALFVYFGAALTSGNLMNHISTTIPLCFISGLLMVQKTDANLNEIS